jgi:hypothetical protein
MEYSKMMKRVKHGNFFLKLINIANIEYIVALTRMGGFKAGYILHIKGEVIDMEAIVEMTAADVVSCRDLSSSDVSSEVSDKIVDLLRDYCSENRIW